MAGHAKCAANRREFHRARIGDANADPLARMAISFDWLRYAVKQMNAADAARTAEAFNYFVKYFLTREG